MKFYFTFGQMYRDQVHPTYPKANPNGWVTIIADSENEAREKAEELFDGHYATNYTECFDIRKPSES